MTEAGTSPAAGGALPPGTFRIDRDGTWRHDGVEVTHPGVLRNLFDNLRAEGNAHYLAMGPARVPVEVDDAPFVVVRIERPEGADEPAAHLSDGSVEPLALDTLALDARGVPYCRVRSGRFRARLSVPAWLQLIRSAEADPVTGDPVLVLGGRRLRLRPG
jgi:hypothetical protein